MHRHVGSLLTLALALCLSGPPIFAAEPQLATENTRFPSAGTVLAGTLVLPPQIVAAVVLVQGSGPTERMLGFANSLAKQGIATLTYDKRGVGESGGLYVGTHNAEPSNLQLLAQDAACAVHELTRRLPSIERLRALMAQGKPFEFKLFPASAHDPDEKDAFAATIEWIKSTASQLNPVNTIASTP
jgi:hypothetical protein